MTMLVAIAGVCLAAVLAFYFIPAARNFMRDSETLLFARMQMVGGTAWTVLTQVDLAPLLSPQALTIWLILSGFITEIARRARADNL